MAFDGDDFGNVLKYPFQDPQWFSKLCVQGAVLLLLSVFLVGIPFLTGFIISCTKKGLNAESTLPGWDEWGEFWTLGWKTIAVNIIYALPLIALYALVTIGFIVGAGTGEEVLLGVSFLGGIAGYVLTLLYGVVMIFVQSTTSAAIASGRTISECLEIHDRIWPYVKANFGSIIIAAVAGWVATMLSYVGIFALGIGLLFTFNYGFACIGYANGLVAKKSKAKL